MRILWLTNRVIPEIEELAGLQTGTVNEGWLNTLFHQLCSNPDIDMTIICMGAKTERSGETALCSWYTFEESYIDEIHYSDSITEKLAQVIDVQKPNLIHIWGTEYPHSLSMLKAAESRGVLNNVVLSIQGLISCLSHHYYDGIPADEITPRSIIDILKRTDLKGQKDAFYQRGISEINAINTVKHVIGRTAWDRIAVHQINPHVHYHCCNETLREEFYSGKWEYERCKKHSIFISQASYPIKGFHILIKALSGLLSRYPDLQVNVAGESPIQAKGFREWLRLSEYGRYLKRIISPKMIDHIHFCGKLSALQMKEQYLSCNVFVSCSALENSSNSIGEAMMLGVPIVSSNVGGIPSIIDSPKEGLLYPSTEFNMLDYYIGKVFDDVKMATDMGQAAQCRAKNTHDSAKNYLRILEIYENVSE